MSLPAALATIDAVDANAPDANTPDANATDATDTTDDASDTSDASDMDATDAPAWPDWPQPRTVYITVDDAGDFVVYIDRDPAGAPDHTIVCPVPHGMSAVAEYLATLDLSRCETLTFRYVDLDLLDGCEGYLPPATYDLITDFDDQGFALATLRILDCDRPDHLLALVAAGIFPNLACLDLTGSHAPRDRVLATLDKRVGRCAPLARIVLDHFRRDSPRNVWHYLAIDAHVDTIELVEEEEED